MKYRSLGLAAIVLAAMLVPAVSWLAAAPPEADGNWPQWRGPLATGSAPDADPPIEWSESDYKWKVEIPGQGTSTPIIWKNHVFILTAIPTGKKVEKPADENAENEESEADQPRARDPERRGPREGRGERGDRPRGDGERGDGERGERGGRGGRGPGGFGPGGRGPGGFGGRGGFGRSRAPDEVFQFVLLCLDRDSGKTVWQKIAREEVPHEGHHQDHGYASFSPATDGTCVIAYFGSRGLHCFEMDGRPRWSKDLGRQRTRNGFGEGTSPVLHGNAVVVNWDHEGDDDFIAAFDKRTGKELWRQPREEPTSWSTPLVVEYEGKTVVVTPGTEQCRAYDLKTGEMVWHCAGLTSNPIPSPVGADGMVYLTSGFRGSALYAIELGHDGDLDDSDAIAWTLDRATPYVPSPLLYEGKLFFFSSNNAILSCHDAKTGKVVFGPKRVEGMEGVYASPVGAGGRVYMVGRNGTSVVIALGDEYEVLAVNRLNERIDASPAVVGKQLFLRGEKSLYCFEK